MAASGAEAVSDPALTQPEAREVARDHVRQKLERGVSRARMNAIELEGCVGPNEDGYQLRRGRITVPMIGEPKHTFRVDHLVDEIEAEAREEFWRHWRAYRWDRSAVGYLGLALNGLRAIGHRRGLLPVPPGPVGFEDPNGEDPVQGELFGGAA